MSNHHVTVEDGRLTKFVCEDDQAPCRNYPACECERWSDDHAEEYGEGHGKVHHKDCWLQGWFDNPESTMYYGPEDENWDDGGPPKGLTRSGYIEFEFEECPTWWFVEEEV